MGVTFEHPAWLLLIIAAVPMAWAGLRWFAPMSRIRRWSAVLLRVLLISLISAMLAGASSVRRTDRLAVIGVVDVSESVRMFGDIGRGPDGRARDPMQAARDFFAVAEKQRGPDDLLGLVVFDGKSLAVATPTRGSIADRSLDVRMAEGTDIAAALRYASALIPPGASGRLVLFSDGNETAGDAAGAARELASRAGSRVPIDVIPVKLSATREVMIESVDVPPRAPAESTITARVTLRSTGRASGTLNLLREGEAIDINGAEPGFGRRVTLREGLNVELISIPLPAGKIHRFEAVFEPDRENGQPVGDTRLENNRGDAFTVTPGKGSVLLVDGVGNAGAGSGGLMLAETVRRSGIDVTAVPPEGIPASLLALEAFDLVILENVPADAVPVETQQALVAHVRDMGGGLVMIGGPDSFGAGGWKGSVLEPILPVKLDLPEQLVQPDAAIVFIIDNSGSMGRQVFGSASSQQEIANESTAMAIRTLDKKDLVGVIVFNSQTSILVPLAPNLDPKETGEKVLSIAPGGGTIMAPALDEAHRQLRDVRAAVKHVIVLSDGVSMGKEALPGIAAKMRADGITVSAIGVGNEMDPETMGLIAQRGGGQYYAVDNPALLPKFFLKAIRVIRTPLIREGAFQPIMLPVASSLTAGLDRPPRLGGLVLTQRRPEATITYAMAAPTGEPLLAHWNVDLGQVAAFTSDAHRWAAGWLAWPGYGQFWTQVARSIARAGTPGRLDLTSEVAGDSLRLHLDAAGENGQPLDLLSTPVTVYPPGGRAPIQATLTQTGPGVYEGNVPARESGNYVAVVKPRLGSQQLTPVMGGSSVASGVEFRSLTTNAALLQTISRESGGRVLEVPIAGASSQAFPKLFDRSDVPPSVARTPLWGPLLLWSLVVLLLDVGTRRIAWDRFVSREFGVDLHGAAADAVRERGNEAAATVGRLRARDEVVAAGSPSGTALAGDDAERVAAAARERRRASRLVQAQAASEVERLPAQTTQEAAAPMTDAGSKEQAPTVQVVDESGLMAAKRRARERFEKDGA